MIWYGDVIGKIILFFGIGIGISFIYTIILFCNAFINDTQPKLPKYVKTYGRLVGEDFKQLTFDGIIFGHIFTIWFCLLLSLSWIVSVPIIILVSIIFTLRNKKRKQKGIL